MARMVTWENPTQNTDDTPFNPATEIAGYEIGFDNKPAVAIPIGTATSYDVEQLDAYKALKSGAHTIQLAVVSKVGTKSAPATTSFPIKGTPRAVTSLAMA